MQIFKYVLLCIALESQMTMACAASQVWVGTWAASQQIADAKSALPSADMTDVALRETVHVSRGGAMIRVRLSNAFGLQALHLTSVHIARPVDSGSSAIDAASDHTQLFNGRPDVVIPPAAEYLSDLIAHPLAALSDLIVSMLSGVDVQAASNGYSVVALGDSITDGHATTNGNDRWTDVLAQ